MFADVRMQLLDVDENDELLYALHALLMLLPQSQAFEMLHKRLFAISGFKKNKGRLVGFSVSW